MAKDKEAWDPKDPDYKLGKKLGKVQKEIEDRNKGGNDKGRKK